MTRKKKDLSKKRASYKGRLTAFGKYIHELSSTVISPQQINELQLRIGKIESLYEQYDEVQLKIECLSGDLQSQITERDDFESIYYRSLAIAQDILSRNPKIPRSETVESSHTERAANHKLIKLPTISLPKFHGSYDNWLEFHDTFSSLIHSNDGMDEINKFHYLRSSLEGSAAVIIQSIEFSASNYSVAWQLLCDRYNNKRLLIQNHVTNLFNVDSIKNPKKPLNYVPANAVDGAGSLKSHSAASPSDNSQSPTSLTLTTYCVDTPSEMQQDVLLSTALVTVIDANGRECIVRALLDCASSSCIITEKMCHMLNLPCVNIDKPIFGINKTQTNTTKMCRVLINSLNEKYSKNLLCYVLPSITDDVPCHSIDISHLNLPDDITLADPQFYKASEIDMIIGSNVFWELLGSRKINLGANNPILWETRLGWLVSGPINGGHGSSPLICNFTKVDLNDFGNDDTQNLLSRFWQLEEVGPKSSYSEEEQMCEKHFVQNTTRLKDGRFCRECLYVNGNPTTPSSLINHLRPVRL
ncbi:Gag-pol polyprotein [Operophtera brumata]|uniref:Gag-pol polyprotein n=1 Tax=Operophtera brumata TaxID=104452 RepID=A0A0L7LCY9_OPEBR|nr:Gag-pol polyprotein [Operophtera brumata]